GKFLLVAATCGPPRSPLRPPPALKAGDRDRTPSACLCPPGFVRRSEVCTRPGRFVEILQLNVQRLHLRPSETRACSGGKVPVSRQFLAGNAFHPIPFPHTRARRLSGPRSWSRSDYQVQWCSGWLPRGNSRSSRLKLSVYPECTCGVHDSGCKYAAVEERSS